MEARRVRFEQGVREAHRQFKQKVLRFLRESNLLSIATAPVISALIVPIALLDR